MVLRLCALLLAMICIAAAPEQGAPVRYRLTREDLIRTDQTLVVRLSVQAPKAKSAEMTKLVFRWQDKTSNEVANGMWERTDIGHRADIMIVAQVAAGTKEHSPMLMLSTQQSSPERKGPDDKNHHGGAYTFEAHRLAGDSKVADVVDVDVKDGDYPAGEKLKVGVVGGQPLYLSLEPFPAD